MANFKEAFLKLDTWRRVRTQYADLSGGAKRPIRPTAPSPIDPQKESIRFYLNETPRAEGVSKQTTGRRLLERPLVNYPE